MHPRFPRDARQILAVAAVLAVVAWAGVFWPRPRDLVVTFLDVGQGDCTVIQTPCKQTVLIDGGGVAPEASNHYDVGSKTVLPFLRAQGVNSIDLIVASHPHEDHIGGLVSVIQQMPVKAVLDSSVPHPSILYHKFLQQIERRGIRYYSARRGMTIQLSRHIEMDILNPKPGTSVSEDLNDSSIVLRLRYRNVSFLFAGDCQTEAEMDICRSGAGVRATVLKVGHHGSPKSTSGLWVRRVRPQVAVISVGRNNSFNHPSPAVVRRLQAARCRVYRTDKDGAVQIRTNGRILKIRVFRDDR